MNNLSFFIPAFNCAGTITEAVESIMETNFEPGDELIIVNDFSTDDTVEILKDLKEKYPIIHLIDHKINKGGAAARNTAIENAKNELLFCLDADNILAHSSIADLKAYLLLQNADVASFERQHIFQKDKQAPVDIWSLPPGTFEIDAYLNGKNTPGQHGNYLFTKQSWIKAQGYAAGTGALDTWTFGLRQAIAGAKIVILKDSHYFHRLDHEKSYWMRDAEANLWSVSLKATLALLPFYDLIEEKYLTYMLGRGRYTWFFNLRNRPVRLVAKGSKDEFYKDIHQKLFKHLYPKSSIVKRGIGRLRRRFKK